MSSTRPAASAGGATHSDPVHASAANTRLTVANRTAIPSSILVSNLYCQRIRVGRFYSAQFVLLIRRREPAVARP